jgi:hypothetical protein
MIGTSSNSAVVARCGTILPSWDSREQFSNTRQGKICLLTVVTVLAFAFAAVADASPRHLFLDPALLAHREHAELRVNPPRQSEIVISPDRPWEKRMISFYTTVLDEGGRLRMWYICRDDQNRPNLAYAESVDGVKWTRPELGLVEHDGSKRNNLVGVPSLDGAVFRDPRAKPGEEYVYVSHATSEGTFRYTSPDGLRWKRDPQPLLPFRADTQNITFWDDRVGRYVLYLRGWDVGSEWRQRLRKVVRLELDTLARPAGITPSGRGANPENPRDRPRIADEIPTVLRADAGDPDGTDVYTISAQRYPLDPQWYVGFPSFFLRDKHISDGRLEVQFVGSRDGVKWERYDRAPYIAPGLAGGESQNMTYIGPGLIVRGDEIWQYGTGFRGRHGAVEERKLRPEGAIYRYVQRVDGFVSLDTGNEAGRVRTVPLKIDGGRLLLNVDTGALGQLRVGLVGGNGKPLPGFDTSDCDPVWINSTGALVTWRGNADLSALRGREVVFEFSSRRTKLYSFRFE